MLTAPDVPRRLRRRSPAADYLFLIDHGDLGAEVTIAGDAVELLTGELLTGKPVPGSVTLAPGENTVLREPRRA